MNSKILLSLCSLLLLASVALGQSPPVGVFAEVNQVSVTEGGSFIITVSANARQTFDYAVLVTFDLYDAPGHPGANDLRGAIVSSVAIPANQLSAPPLNVTALIDGLYEGNETFEVRINADNPVFPAYRPISPTNVFITILDADAAPQVYFRTTTGTVTEDNVTVPISVLLSPRSQAAVRVNWAIASSPLTTATYSTDFNMVLGGQNGTLVFPSGVGTNALDLRVIEDTTDEPDERVVLNLSNPIGATLRAGFSTNAITILDDDLPPTVSFETATSSALENAGTRAINVRLSGASGRTVTVGWSITGGTTTAGSDFTGATAGTLTFNPGQTLATLRLPVVNDTVEEADETVVFSLSAPSNATLAAPSTHTFTILDDDVSISWGPMQINAFGQKQTNVAESIGTVLVPVRLSRALSVPVSVNVKDTNRTTSATVGVDYVLNNTSVLISPPATEGFVSITILNDTLDEFDEIIDLDLRSPNLGQVTGSATARVAIVDDDARPTVQFFRSTATDYETNGLMYVDLVLSAPSGIGVSVGFGVGGTAVEGRDYTILNGTDRIYFNEGETNATIYLSYVNNAIYDGNRTIQFTLFPGPIYAVLGARTVHTLTVIDSLSPPKAFFGDFPTSFPEAITSLSMLVHLSVPAAFPVKVNVAVTGGTATGGGVDFSLNARTVYFEAGETRKNVNLTCVNDVLDELDETISLSLSPGTPIRFPLPDDGYTAIGVAGITNRTFTIEDDDEPPTASIQQIFFLLSEGQSTDAIIRLTKPSGLTVSLNMEQIGGNVSPADFLISPTLLTFLPGQTQKVVTVTAFDDKLVEGDEGFMLAMIKADRVIPDRVILGSARVFYIRDLDGTHVAPEDATAEGFNPGHRVRFRKAAAATAITTINEAENLLTFPLPDARVAFEVTDNGVATINYVDAATDVPPQGYFGSDRDFHAVPGSPTFAAGDINHFAMSARGYLYVPFAGNWNFTVRSDDGFRLRIGANNTVVTEYVNGRGPSDSVAVVDFPQPGYYRYELTYFEWAGGAQVEFLAQAPFLGTGNQLVGSGNDDLLVFRDLDIPPVVLPVREPFIPGGAGHQVEFRKASHSVPNVAVAQNVLSLPVGDARVLAVAADNGVSVINYDDSSGTSGLFPGDRQIATPPLSASKGSFSAGAEDDFAMRAIGFIQVTNPGVWSFVVNSDDGFQLRLGTNQQVVSAYLDPRAPAATTNRVNLPIAGYYPFELIFFEFGGGALVEFFAFGPGQPVPKLVGDASGVLRVYQTGTEVRLTITRSGNQAILRWPGAASGFTLERCSALAGASTVWTPVSGTSSVVGQSWQQTDNLSGTGARFYRLRKP